MATYQQISRKTIDFRLELSRENPFLLGDIAQIEGILINLLSNADQAIEKSGCIQIKTEMITVDSDVSAQHPWEFPAGKYLCIKVSDDGCGMPPETQSRIFEPFFTTKQVGEGTGLCLANVFGIVKNHEGHILCDSVEGFGTCFSLYFPKVDEVEQPEEIPDSVNVIGEGTILIAEDEPPILELLSNFVSEIGYKVIKATNGKEATEIYEERKSEISLIILDLRMPVMSGRDALRIIRESDSKIPILISTGFSENIEDISQYGIQAFLRKPYRMSELAETISRVLSHPENSKK